MMFVMQGREVHTTGTLLSELGASRGRRVEHQWAARVGIEVNLSKSSRVLTAVRRRPESTVYMPLVDASTGVRCDGCREVV